jgi:two-component system, OmpR family, response regulator RegX3
MVVKVLLVEDDDGIALPLEAGLIHHGYAVTRVSRGADVPAALPADIVLLDLGLPDMDGLDVCRNIRQFNQKLPIIVISARGSEIDRVVGLELGADDYLAKPFGMRELIARIRAVMRRTDAPPSENSANSPAAIATLGAANVADQEPDSNPRVRSIGELTIDLRTHRVSKDGVEIALTTKEFGVLSMLSADPGAVVTRSDLIEQVWDEHWYGPTKTLDVHVAQLRRKLGDPAWIENVRSVGYRLVDPSAAS